MNSHKRYASSSKLLAEHLKLFLILGCILCLVSADSLNELVIEEVNHADYYIDNRTKQTLTLKGSQNGIHLSTTFLTKSIPPQSKRLIFKFSEYTGGHVMPSNAWVSFFIYSGKQLVYSGVKNEDWQESGSLDGRLQYTLVIQ